MNKVTLRASFWFKIMFFEDILLGEIFRENYQGLSDIVVSIIYMYQTIQYTQCSHIEYLLWLLKNQLGAMCFFVKGGIQEKLANILIAMGFEPLYFLYICQWDPLENNSHYFFQHFGVLTRIYVWLHMIFPQGLFFLLRVCC